MRLTLSRAALVALVLAMPVSSVALAQDSSQPSSSEPSAAPSVAPSPSDQTPSSAPSSQDQVPSSGPSEQPSSQPPAQLQTGAAAPAAPDKHPRAPGEIYQDLNFFGEVFDRIRSEYVDPPEGSGTIAIAMDTEGRPFASSAHNVSRIVVPPASDPPVVFTTMLPATGAPTPAACR